MSQFKAIQLTINATTLNGKEIEVSTTSPRMIKYWVTAFSRNPKLNQLGLFKDSDDNLQLGFIKYQGTKVLTVTNMTMEVNEIEDPAADDSWI